MPSSSASTSNWDFTPVINLLRSPTYQSGNQPIPGSNCPDPSVTSNVPQKVNKDDVKISSVQVNPPSDSRASSPKLGDFSALWDALGAPSPHTASIHSEPNAQKTPPLQPTSPVVILKRPPVKDPEVEKPRSLPKTPPRTPAKSSTCLNVSQSFDPPVRGRDKSFVVPTIPSHNGRPARTTCDPSSSESNTGAESDGYLSIFDRPKPKPRSSPPMIPSQVGIAEAIPKSVETPPSSFDDLNEFLTPSAIKGLSENGKVRLQPLVYKTLTDQRVGLLTKLLKKFPDYVELVTQIGRPLSSTKKDAASRPIHVFVDMSNIMVGFHDSMKVSRNIPVETRIRRLPLSFHNFSLILERGRPVAKRVLVGSDRYAAIDESEQLGYETNILDRVQKIKQPTLRQLRFRKNARMGLQDGYHGSETNDMPEGRWVEQGVDEILHLKILESLLDTAQPATIVLATGDAAEAEFSGGFMKMVERALQRGWNVELASFSQVTSYAYRKKEFRTRWKGQFQMIVLDEYIEELLDS